MCVDLDFQSSGISTYITQHLYKVDILKSCVNEDNVFEYNQNFSLKTDVLRFSKVVFVDDKDMQLTGLIKRSFYATSHTLTSRI